MHQERGYSSARTAEDATVGREEVQLRRNPKLHEFDRWRAYAYHINVVGVVSPYWTLPPRLARLSFSLEAWTSLTRYGPIPLIPNVRRLSLRGSETQYVSPNTLLSPLGKHLVRLQLSARRRETDFPEILRRIAVCAPQLDELVIVEEPDSVPSPSTNVAGIDGSLPACLRALSCLRALRIKGTPVSATTLRTIGSICSLEYLCIELSSSDVHADTHELLSACLFALPHLRVLQIKSVPILPRTLLTIGSLHFLEYLGIDVSSLTYSSPYLCSRYRGTFPSIKELCVRIDDLNWVTAFLAHISSPFLECVRTTYCGPLIPPGGVDHLFFAIAHHDSRLAFRRLMIDCVRLQPTCDLSSALRPLLALPSLVVLSLVGWTSIIVDDHTLDAMSRAWSQLVNLTLGYFPGRPHPEPGEYWHVAPKATLAGLAPLARRCPSLQQISMTINTDVGIPAHGPPQRSLRPPASQMLVLHVGWTGPPRDPVRTAAFLSELFPRLLTVEIYPKIGAQHDETVRGWRHVLDLVHRFKLIRNQERNWFIEQSRRTSFRWSGS